MADMRLIEKWLPIAAIGEESVRERRALSALPAPYYLHVWWARRPLIASRAAILASLLPATANKGDFFSLLRIDGDPVKARRQINKEKRSGTRGGNPYGYDRAFTCAPSAKQISASIGRDTIRVLDPTAGGGSIPFESVRMGFETYANDLNNVAATILAATVDFPVRFGTPLIKAFNDLGTEFIQLATGELKSIFPQGVDGSELPTRYVWARGATCPYCNGQIPISPNWKLQANGAGVRLRPQCASGPGSSGRYCEFEIVDTLQEQSSGTVAGANVICPFPDCKRVIELEEVKRQGESGTLFEILFAVVVKRRVVRRSKTGREKSSWVLVFRPPTKEDHDQRKVDSMHATKLPEWQALDIIPSEFLPIDTESWTHGNTLHQYGAKKFSDLFSKRQLLVHGTSVAIFRQLLEREESRGALSDLTKAAFVYLALAIDKLVDWNSFQCTWDLEKQRMAHTFQVHAFPIRWSFAEMDVIAGGGYHWVVSQTSRCISELIKLTNGKEDRNLFSEKLESLKPAKVSLQTGAELSHISDHSIDAVVMDPPYGANVMYAELSDFFYVWLKRTAGLLMPELFTRQLTDKESEAVANKAKFRGQNRSSALATRNYQECMGAIFEECRRVLKPEGIMTVMFTHKEAGAWDALAKGLIASGFFITASWPVNTEAETSTHIKNKAAANSTILLVCRPRPAAEAEQVTYWEDLEPLVAKAVRDRIKEFQEAGMSGVDLYLASFGPALQEFSRHWPLRRGTPRPEPLARKRRKQAEMFEEEVDLFAVTPEDALDAARREVKTWRLNQLAHLHSRADLDSTTSWFVLAWDAFKAPVFAYDEGLRLARAVGVDLDGQLIGRICAKKGSDIKLWDSKTRAEKGSLGGADGGRSMLDALHHAAHRARTRSLEAARDLLDDSGLSNDPMFLAAMEAVLEVLPPSRTFTQVELTGDLKSASDDFDALEKLRRLAYADKVDEPKQLEFWAEEAA